MTPAAVAFLTVLTGVLVAVVGAALLWGPGALIGGGVALVVVGLFGIDLGGRGRA